MPPIDVQELAHAHHQDVYELKLLLSRATHDINAAHEANRRNEAALAELKKELDRLHWYLENLECVQEVVEQSLWVKQTRHVIVWVASGITGAVMLWHTLIQFLRDHHK